jgi:uncharacterized RDD family membrane protein YckC
VASTSRQSRYILPSRSPEPVVAAGPGAAGFVSRSVAMVIDLAIVLVLTLGGTSVAQLVGTLLPKWIWFVAALPVVLGVVVSFVPLAYFFLTVAVAGRTAGKAVMGLEVVAADGTRLSAPRALIRAVAYLVSVIPLFVGFLWVLVDRDRRAWHDHIAGSRVVFNRRGQAL